MGAPSEMKPGSRQQHRSAIVWCLLAANDLRA
jgi:hypothetical protein